MYNWNAFKNKPFGLKGMQFMLAFYGHIPSEEKLIKNFNNTHVYILNVYLYQVIVQDYSCITEFKKHINNCAITNFSIKLDEVFKISDEG